MADLTYESLSMNSFCSDTTISELVTLSQSDSSEDRAYSDTTISELVTLSDSDEDKKDEIDAMLSELDEMYASESSESDSGDDSEDEKVPEDSFTIEEEELLLDNHQIVKWCKGDVSFLGNKKTEDAWGRGIMRKRNPALKFVNQWTSKFGEYLAEEIYRLLGYKVKRPKKLGGKIPDLETEDFIVEVKTGTFFTTGTAHEKIVSVPWHYSRIPELYGKPLVILCIGGAEREARKYEALGEMEENSPKRILKEAHDKLKITFVGFSELLQKVKL